MKETGLMFKAPLVRSILAGQKTQTRRVVKPQPAAGQGMVNAGYCGDRHLWLRDGPCDETDPAYEWRCPMGQPGDRIYVRETFAHHPEFAQMAFRADGEEFEDADGWRWEPKWTPAIHMPRELARIWLEVTGVRVERLQDISAADALKEGLEQCTDLPHRWENPVCFQTAVQLFKELWESTGGDWAANPWVWVIDFKTISTTGRPA
ncbi:MAG: hypothetical protein LBJ15_19310 [Comamonas sp.]|jgi:hypothetical protein|uniref:hypothetical protein n=1 Tax=Comamonas sp. TaxID=34028 RepID=UPI002823C3EC|nr:hypothetical protein [Comamonas sp.]MDR0216126.1 hypothetical protein [Comamonas sp.]